jgi:hypothetical protein
MAASNLLSAPSNLLDLEVAFNRGEHDEGCDCILEWYSSSILEIEF